MRKLKYFTITFAIALMLFLIPSISKTSVTVNRNVYSNDGSMRYDFAGLTLDTTHEYGFTKQLLKLWKIGI